MRSESENELLRKGLDEARSETAPPWIWERIEAELRARDRSGGAPSASRRSRWSGLAKLAAGLIGLVGWLGAAWAIGALAESRSTPSRAPSGTLPTPLAYLTRHEPLEDDAIGLDGAPEVQLLAQFLERKETRR